MGKSDTGKSTLANILLHGRKIELSELNLVNDKNSFEVRESID